MQQEMQSEAKLSSVRQADPIEEEQDGGNEDHSQNHGVRFNQAAPNESSKEMLQELKVESEDLMSTMKSKQEEVIKSIVLT